MRFELFLLACLGPFAALEAKKLPVLPPSHPYVMSIELIFNEDNIIDFITESLFATINENLDENKNCNITLFDVLTILSAENLTPAVNDLNITLQDDDVTELIRGLNYSELAVIISPKKVYRNVVNAYFQNATQDLLSCLNILDVTAEFTTAYAFGTDEELFRAFQKGNFSVYNLQEIAAIVNAPLDGISKTLGLKHYDTPYVKSVINNNLTELLIVRGLEKDGFRKFLEASELEVGNFKKIKSFKNFYKIRTEGESLGVAVGSNEVITNDNSIIESLINLDRYVSLKVRSLQNSKMKYLVGADGVEEEKEGVFKIHIEEDLLNYINKTKSYQEVLTKNCTYVTQDVKHRLIAQNVSVNIVETKLSIPKVLGTVYKKGSPLVCESLLYGLAEINNIDSITFTKVGEEDNVAKIDGSALNELFDLFTSLLQLFDVCSYTDCKVHGVNTDVSGGGEAQTPLQSETQTQSELEAQSQFENDVQSQSGNEDQIQSEVQAQNQSENETQAQIQGQESETEAQNQSVNNAKGQAEAHTQNANEIHIQSEAEAENQFANEAETQAQIQSEAEVQNQFENEAETQAQIQSEVEVQNQLENEAETQAQIQSETEAQNQSNNEAQIQSEMEAQNQSKDEAQAQVQIQPVTEAQNQAGNETKSESEAQAPSVTEVQIQSEIPEQIQSEIQEQNQSESEGQTQSKIEIQTEAATESDSEVWFQFETEIQADAEAPIDSDIQFPTEAESENLDAVAEVNK